MVIKRKLEIEKVIDKGGYVDADKSSKCEWVMFSLRMKADMSKQIDEALKERVGISKTGFILQAIQEKLKNER